MLKAQTGDLYVNKLLQDECKLGNNILFLHGNGLLKDLLMPYVKFGKAFYLEAILSAYSLFLYLILVLSVGGKKNVDTRIRFLFLLGINILQYFAHLMVSTLYFLLLNDEAEPVLFGGEIWIPVVTGRNTTSDLWNCSKIKCFLRHLEPL